MADLKLCPISELSPCLFGDTRCLCKDCTRNAAYKDCKRGYCIDCFECEEAGEQVHDIFLCTAYEHRPGLPPEPLEEGTK